MHVDEERFAGFQRERPHLLGMAFRLLGSEADAQDVVQEAWIRYARADVGEVRNLPAWLTTVVTRLCVDLLRRSRDVPGESAGLLETPADRGDEPEQAALLAGELAEALMIVVDELTPEQRVALILHDVFGAPFAEIAQVLDTTVASAKKLASRARARVRHRAAAPAADPRTAHRVVSAFLKAAQQGDIDGLVRLLHPGVTRTADPHTLPVGAAQRVQGAQTVITETLAFQRNARRARVVTIDGQAGIAVLSQGKVQAALVFRVTGGQIVHYDVIADPRRLALLHIGDHAGFRGRLTEGCREPAGNQRKDRT
ncbi:MAG TPA: sigma-70 family RNA polymerase sigma factor [Streptosporangiaceae bacterium]|nr:sigma-70 family RNA polymerase sigma factor [Streptosporangiaceae bacterium]